VDKPDPPGGKKKIPLKKKVINDAILANRDLSQV
jgi:hypothetical protein